jgi:hypothetical protein
MQQRQILDLPISSEKAPTLFSSCVTELILSSLGYEFYVERSGDNYLVVSHVEGVFNSYCQ